MTNNFSFEPNKATKQIHISREFNAPVEKIWKAWTEPELLDKWWGPKPNRVETKIMDFKVGGIWQFAMVTPEGNKHWLCAKFTGIESGSRILTSAVFCDTEGNIVGGESKWFRDTKFTTIDGDRTKVDIMINFEEEETFDQFANAHNGYFKTGTAIGYDQLDELLASN